MKTEGFDTIKLKAEGETLWVTLDRPKLNLVNQEMMEELIAVWHDLRKEPNLRFVILEAAGEDFTAGIDLRQVSVKEFTPEYARLGQLAGHELMRSLEGLEQVTLASLKGAVVGAGLALALACDFRIMADDGFFILPEINIGTYFTWGCTPRLVRQVGASKAMEIIMTADPLPAGEALRLGLANKIAPKAELNQVCREFIAKIAAKSPTSVRLTKKIALAASMQGFGDLFVCEPELMQILAFSGESRDGIGAFLDKRDPDFKHSIRRFKTPSRR
ncbi:MAG: enoyl-CoA hydratase/isomerase family protein [Thermodesulfobacteriota bacterium]